MFKGDLYKVSSPMLQRHYATPSARQETAPQKEQEPSSIHRVSHSLLQLQAAYGNRYVQQIMGESHAAPTASPVIQTKLVLGPTDDPYEREADRVAQQATGPATSLSRRATPLTNTAIGRMSTQPGTTDGNVNASVQQGIQSARGGGHSLPDAVRTQMEQSLGADFSGVRIHTGARADQLNQSLQARAFTTGQDIFFRRGEYNPSGQSGQQILAHELTHVVQQGAHSTQTNIIQRAGVKSELKAAEQRYLRFKDDVNNIETLHDRYLGAVYNAYKPNSANPKQYFGDRTDRDKSKGQLKEPVAQEKAQRFNHWTANAIASSNRLFEELIAATELANDKDRGVEDITMGTNTVTEPDVFLGRTHALEVKHIDTDTYSAVDQHVKKGTAQLEKRERNPVHNKSIKHRTLHLRVTNPGNTYPFTATELKGIKKPTRKQLRRALSQRAIKYNKATEAITLKLISNNPKIGSVDVNI
ncbi:MAG: DUF4157 domain-containing protein [Caldilineaceae bacterium]|nr:DUF4157 domain-containing protein [Caldilineaceae bacterium]MCB0094995.1 DUF4157 domain-containing protein [Caldilineaceae bacterium]